MLFPHGRRKKNLPVNLPFWMLALPAGGVWDFGFRIQVTMEGVAMEKSCEGCTVAFSFGRSQIQFNPRNHHKHGRSLRV